MEGRRIRWRDREMAIGFNRREGATFHDIQYDNRPLFDRAPIAEMIAPYGGPNEQHAARTCSISANMGPRTR